MEREFTNELRKRNKNKFIEVVSEQLARLKNGSVNIPAFIEAEEAYYDFQKAGMFDYYGYLI